MSPFIAMLLKWFNDFKKGRQVRTYKYRIGSPINLWDVDLGIGTVVDFIAVNSDVKDSAVDIGVDTSAADTAVANPAMDSDIVGPAVENSFVDNSVAESVMEKSVVDLAADDSVAATVVDISLVLPVGDDPIVDPVIEDSVDGNSVAVRIWQRVPENPSGQRQPTSPVLGTRKQAAPF